MFKTAKLVLSIVLISVADLSSVVSSYVRVWRSLLGSSCVCLQTLVWGFSFLMSCLMAEVVE